METLARWLEVSYSRPMANSPESMNTDKTLGEVLDSGTQFLVRKGIENPRLACELLAARLLGCKRLELTLRHDQRLVDKHVDAMRRGLVRVAGGEPVQYVLGEWDFMEHTFHVDRRALIPRPETEQLVAAVLACTELWSRPRPAVLDVGTGTGCIAISLALARPEGIFVGLDISAEAISLAKENARRLGVADRIVLAKGEISEGVEPETMDAVVANLPYVATPEYEGLPVHIREYEPRLALDGGPNGLAVIEPVVQDAAIVLKSGGYLFLEIGADQGEGVSRLVQHEGFSAIEIRKDLAGKDRIVFCRLGR
jgi:release factor glutamine methyltransferase